MSKGPVILCLLVSVGLHVAFFGLPSVFSPVGEKPRTVEVGLVSLPPQVAGQKNDGVENGPAPSAPSPDKREPGRSGESLKRLLNAPLAQPRNKTTPPSRTPVPLVSPLPEVPPEPVVEKVTPSPPSFSEPLPETMPSEIPDEPTVSLPSGGDHASENPRGSETSEREKAIVNIPLVEAFPRYDRNAPPLYPRLARERGWEGEVLLRVVVTEGGRVRHVTVERSSGHVLLDETALRAVRRWQFHPCRLGATPIEGEVRVPVRFELRES